VFQNLISNAVKYNDKPIGVVSVHCRDQEDFLQFSVVDNGPGMDPRYYKKIFNIFETLSSRDQADSTGVGLAVVKRIIEGWGGRIWVRSRVGEGSIFVFTLLKQIARADHEKYQTSVAS
jgi:signal transduction histidine kinase